MLAAIDSQTDVESSGELARRWAAVGLLCSTFLLEVMGSTSAFAAAPAIEDALGMSQSDLQWSITAATLPAGALLLVGGRAADLFGRRRVFLLGLAVLIVSSLGCGLASSPTELIAWRLAQGVGSALLMPAALSLVIGTFAEPARRSRALSLWSAVGGLGATAGLLIGGLVTSDFGWQWVFLINVPAGLVVLLLALLLVQESPTPPSSRRLDLSGIATFTAGIALLIYGMSEGPQSGWWHPQSLGLVAVGALLLAVFGRIETRSSRPIVPAWLVRSRAVVAGNVTVLVAGMCVDGLLFTLTLYTQQDRGFSATAFGVLTAIMTVSSVAASWLAQRACGRYGTRAVSLTGLGVLAVTGVMLTIATTMGGRLALLVGGMVVFGLGMGLAYVAGSIASLRNVPEHESGVAAAVQSISFSVGATLGVAVLSTISTAIAGQHPSVDASTSGARAAFVGCVAIASLGALAVSLLVRRRVRSTDATPDLTFAG